MQNIFCPDARSKNLLMRETPETIRENLLVEGFVKNYFIWMKHGETQTNVEGSAKQGTSVGR